MVNDLTILLPSYNTEEVTLNFLKSFVKIHGKGYPLILSENSTEDKTEVSLKVNGVPFFRNPGSTHSPSVQQMIDKCTTKYALLCDTDILFFKKIDKLFEIFLKNDLTLMGEVQGSRGGYNLHPRVAPYFCMMDLSKIRQNGILFHDDKKIDDSGSRGFFNNIPLQINRGGTYYDCGSIIFENCVKKGLKVGNISRIIGEYVRHFEGMSWRTVSKVEGYVRQGNAVYQEYTGVVGRMGLSEVPLGGAFVDGVDE